MPDGGSDLAHEAPILLVDAAREAQREVRIWPEESLG
jgi:hypothetical protein